MTSSPLYRHVPRSSPQGDRPAATLGVHGAPAISRMTAARDADDFVAAPLGRYVVGDKFVTWCEAPDLVGVTVWGALDETCIRAMMAIGAFIHHPDIAPRRRVLVDCRDLEHVDAEVLLGFTTMARDRVPEWTTAIERQVLLVPDGIAGILVSGTLPLLGSAHPMRFVRDPDDALAYLDHPGAAAAHAAVTRVAIEARGRSALLFRLRAQLARDLVGATVERSAAALGMSTRTLQRELGRLDTSFSDELRRVRIATAEGLLAHSDLKIDAIATQVGFGSASRMSAQLRRELNATASVLRARFRGERVNAG